MAKSKQKVLFFLRMGATMGFLNDEISIAFTFLVFVLKVISKDYSKIWYW